MTHQSQKLQFRTLIVGLGQIGMGYDLELPLQYVYSHVRAVRKHPDFELVGGVDPSSENRRQFTEAYGAPGFSDLGEALLKTRPDVVVVAVPTMLHASVVNEALEAPQLPQAILCEKPLAYHLHDAQAMVQRCFEKKVSLYVNYMRRSEPGALEIYNRIQNRQIKTPIKGIVWYTKGFIHNGSHFFNLLELYLGPMQSFQVIRPGRALEKGDAEPDVFVAFQQGEIYFFSIQNENFSLNSMELMAQNGRLRYEQGGKQILWYPAVTDSQLKGYTVLYHEAEIVPVAMQQYQFHVFDQLANALHGKPARLSDAEDALQTLEAINTILEKRL